MNMNKRLEQLKKSREEQRNIREPIQYPPPPDKIIRFRDLSFVLRLDIVGGLLWLIQFILAIFGSLLLSMLMF